jgi:hypothetical protein
MKLIITEEEKNRILGMHQSATSRQYLKEQTESQVSDSVGAYNYFIGIVNKTKTLKKGTSWLGKNTYWVVTSDWNVSQSGVIEGNRSDILMRGITKRNGLYFDVSNNEESMLFNLAKTNARSFLEVLNGNELEKWLPNTQTLKSQITGTPGGNMGLVGGLTNFKSMVKNLPNMSLLLTNYVNASAKPGFKNMVPQDQMDLYTTSATSVKPATPTKP